MPLCYQKMSSARMSRGETLVLVMQPALDADGAPARVLGCAPRDEPLPLFADTPPARCRARLFHVQYPRHAGRCQRMTVSGCTITRVERQPGQYRESHDQKRRSAGFVRVRAR